METGRRKKCVQLISMIKEAAEFRKVHMRNWYQQSLLDGRGARKSLWCYSFRHCAISKRSVKKTIGQCCGEEAVSVSFAVLGNQQSGN